MSYRICCIAPTVMSCETIDPPAWETRVGTGSSNVAPAPRDAVKVSVALDVTIITSAFAPLVSQMVTRKFPLAVDGNIAPSPDWTENVIGLVDPSIDPTVVELARLVYCSDMGYDWAFTT